MTEAQFIHAYQRLLVNTTLNQADLHAAFDKLEAKRPASLR